MIGAAAACADYSADEAVFASIVEGLNSTGYAVVPRGMPEPIAQALHHQQRQLAAAAFAKAGIGRTGERTHNDAIRGDSICWLDNQSLAGYQWLQWLDSLQQYLNRQAYLGLASVETQLAHYRPNTFYKRHVDAFRGGSNRVLSLVSYLNQDWQHHDGGELVLYRSPSDTTGIRIAPEWATVVVFLSEQFPHEVLATARDRYSLAAWFSARATGNSLPLGCS